ncbi:antibiotic biosynthesis monooxygenase [Tenacibaculum sp.]|nr:antibiotic biosynthesis monooxygenase [Tenacibaculum sp.]
MKKKVILEFKVKTEKVNELIIFLENNLENVRNFEGCSQLQVYYNADDEKMIIDEIWKSVGHHQKYLNFISENGVMIELTSFLASELEIKYFDIMAL